MATTCCYIYRGLAETYTKTLLRGDRYSQLTRNYANRGDIDREPVKFIFGNRGQCRIKKRFRVGDPGNTRYVIVSAVTFGNAEAIPARQGVRGAASRPKIS